MKRHWSPILVVALLLSAGCLGYGPSADQSATETTEVTETPTSVETAETTRTDEGGSTEVTPTTTTETDEPIGTSGAPYDLVLKNYGNRTITVNISVVQNTTNESVFDTTVTLGADGDRDFDVPFPETGNYTIRVTLDGTTHSTVWEVEVLPPSYEIIISVDDGEVSFIGSTA